MKRILAGLHIGRIAIRPYAKLFLVLSNRRLKAVTSLCYKERILMKTAYFDIICGAAGDMIIGSMLDAGLDFELLKSELSKLPLDSYKIKIEKTSKHHVTATQFIVKTEETHHHRRLKDIEKIIDESSLNENVKIRSKKVFARLAEAEAKVHGETIANVHFHEVGMVDAVIDICGAVIGFNLLGINKIYCSALTVGKGLVDTQHGTMPVPSPATAELITGYPVIKTEVESEILTPTGAAILTTLCSFEKPPQFTIQAVGYGAGTRDHQARPNLLRLFIGETTSNLDEDEIIQLETNLDRTSPEQIGYIIENLFMSGALDVFITPIQMKKSRPGQMLSVLCKIEDEEKMARIIFSSGITLGIRHKRITRLKLPRKEKTIKTAFGDIAVKLAYFNERVLYFPEFESVANAARQTDKSFDEIYFEIMSQLRKET